MSTAQKSIPQVYTNNQRSAVLLISHKRIFILSMKTLHMVAFILLIVGGLNWGLTALGYNLVNMILGSWPMVEKLVYILVGLSAVLEIATHIFC